METFPPELLEAWLDGELPPDEAARVAAIVATDPAAAGFVDEIKIAGDRLRTTPLPTPVIGSHARWLADWQIARDRSVRRLAGWMTAAASIVLATTLSSTFTRPAAAQPVLAEWESAAVGSVDDDDAPRTARLIAIDLALPAGLER